jgi:hypothetical protein
MPAVVASLGGPLVAPFRRQWVAPFWSPWADLFRRPLVSSSGGPVVTVVRWAVVTPFRRPSMSPVGGPLVARTLVCSFDRAVLGSCYQAAVVRSCDRAGAYDTLGPCHNIHLREQC